MFVLHPESVLLLFLLRRVSCLFQPSNGLLSLLQFFLEAQACLEPDLEVGGAGHQVQPLQRHSFAGGEQQVGALPFR